MPVLGGPSGDNDKAPSQYKQPSRKGKKAWRKNVDVTDIQKGLEELNAQIIKGGVIAEKASDDLFVVDVARDASISKKAPKHLKKTLKADEIIAARSAVAAVPMRKRPADGKTTDGILPAKRQRKDYVSGKELSRLRRVADGQHDATVAIVDATYDVWADAPVPGELHSEFLPIRREAIKKPVTLGEQPVSLSANGKAIPAIYKPKGADSYNPNVEEYLEKLEAEKEKARQTELKRIADLEAERARIEAAARSAAEAEAAEARADLSEWEDDSAWEGFESGGEELSVKVKRPRRKTQAERNKIKRRKEEERRQKHEAAMKKKNAQAHRIKEIAVEVAEAERRLELEKTELSDGSEEGDDGKLRRRQFGRYRLPEKDLELKLVDELEDSLRRLKPEGNLLNDRYRSMLVRGKMEARRKIPFKRQANTKITEKWTYKDFQVPK